MLAVGFWTTVIATASAGVAGWGFASLRRSVGITGVLVAAFLVLYAAGMFIENCGAGGDCHTYVAGR